MHKVKARYDPRGSRGQGFARNEVWNDRHLGHLPLSSTIQALTCGAHVIYALRLTDGTIKIGCTKDLANRASSLQGKILGFRPGSFDEEAEIHATLKPHRARGWEYYEVAPAVLAVVNELRDHFGLDHLEG
jgi:hypothetical protein